MIRFGLVTDSHYADREDHRLRSYRDALRKMEDFITTMNEEKVDFIVHLGDFKDEGIFKKEENTLRYLRTLEEVYTRFTGPTFHCVGNHDLDSITKKMFLENITNTGIPNDQSYFSFDLKGFHFVVLDANYSKEGVDHYMKDDETSWENPYLPPEELAWLETDLKNTRLPSIIFSHHPIFEVFYGQYSMFPKNYREIQDIIDRSGKVKAALHGHIHEEKHVKIRGVHYYTLFAMVDYPYPQNAYAIVELSEENLRIKGYGRSSSINLKFQ